MVVPTAAATSTTPTTLPPSHLLCVHARCVKEEEEIDKETIDAMMKAAAALRPEEPSLPKGKARLMKERKVFQGMDGDGVEDDEDDVDAVMGAAAAVAVDRTRSEDKVMPCVRGAWDTYPFFRSHVRGRDQERIGYECTFFCLEPRQRSTSIVHVNLHTYCVGCDRVPHSFMCVVTPVFGSLCLRSRPLKPTEMEVRLKNCWCDNAGVKTLPAAIIPKIDISRFWKASNVKVMANSQQALYARPLCSENKRDSRAGRKIQLREKGIPAEPRRCRRLGFWRAGQSASIS